MTNTINNKRIGFSIFSIFLLICSVCRAASSSSSHDDDESIVTCGSAIKIKHKETNYYLNSEPKNLNAGSGQQIVTFVQDPVTTDTLWWIRAKHGEPDCIAGTLIACGATIRLTHLNTRRNLHSHAVPSVLSRQQEMSAYGQGDGQGDNGDNFIVECVNKKSKHWRRSDQVRFFHVDTQKYLGTSASLEFTAQNCGGNCPIMGHLEAFGRSAADQFGLFTVDQGVYVSK
ncbi:hypothetical protein MPSEU_000674700 [Mayamaea pseudoterrestris]|nr:hypothetical protein MPSEU_000674700 [Mayamaea pseudoterrestris]